MSQYKLNHNFSARCFKKNDKIVNIQIVIATPGNYLYKINLKEEMGLDLNSVYNLLWKNQFKDLSKELLAEFESRRLILKDEAVNENKALKCDSCEIPYFIKNSVETTLSKISSNGVLWCRDVFTGMLWPYFIDENLKKQFVNNETNQEIQNWMLHNRILSIRKNFQKERESKIKNLRAFFEKYQYIHINDILSQPQRVQLSQYYEYLHKSGMLTLGDRDSPLRAWSHNDAFGRLFNTQLTRFIEEITGRSLKPYFSKYIANLGDSELKIHKDKEENALTVSVLLDYKVDNHSCDDQWQIDVEDKHTSQMKSLKVGLGNGALFNGFLLRHSRPKLKSNHQSRSILLNYVSTDFNGKLL